MMVHYYELEFHAISLGHFQCHSDGLIFFLRGKRQLSSVPFELLNLSHSGALSRARVLCVVIKARVTVRV